MSMIIILVLLLVALDLAALRWGCDSTEPAHSPEWGKRRYLFL